MSGRWASVRVRLLLLAVLLAVWAIVLYATWHSGAGQPRPAHAASAPAPAPAQPASASR